ncbi:class I SAM-dependent methyltransferase [Brachybacterium sp. YJGR34]|uniref:class I SAM-dependent methyltransferase n=1 Tax=Brachybacterium sp. YJGR34 TaxID=2059911 RepID=UPI0013006870|nr:methyltransferase [Brachybacterium sp. YJGR34]
MTTPDPADARPTAPEDDVAPPDQTERVILQAAEEAGGLAAPRDLLVVGDATGALTAAALAALAGHDRARVRSWTVSRTEALALAERFAAEVATGRLLLPTAREPLSLDEFAAGTDARLMLARLPKALSALEELARGAAALAGGDGRDMVIVAGGRTKHMTRRQNEVLARSFAEVRASRGLGKSRALIAAAPRPDRPAPQAASGEAAVPVRGQERVLPLRARGGVFGGARPDAGSLLLLEALDRALVAGEVTAEAAVDLGSGSGLLTAYLAAALPAAQVLGSDDDADAVASTRATLAAAGLERDGVAVTWDAALAGAEADSADLVLLNPPFHDGTAVDATLVQGLLDAAARVLRPGGQLWFVHNSHLRYRPELAARIGPVRQRARDRRFTVLSAVRD